MTDADIARIAQSLARLRAQHLAEGDVVVKAGDIGEVPSAADEDEAPFREMDQAIASSRNKARDARLAQIDEALRRLKDDPESFGLCEVCQDDIPPRRLELLPFVRRCVTCAAKAEQKPMKPVRKKVTDYV